MPNIRIMAVAAAAAVALAFTLSPASARPCDDGNESCEAASRRGSPMKLDQFMKTWKPAASSRKQAKKPAAVKAMPKPAVAETVTPSEAADAPATGMATANPAETSETDGVAITSFDAANELDAAADKVQVVAFNEVNEIDLAAPASAPPPASETTGQSMVSAEVSADQPPADRSWIGKLLLAFAGTIAVAGATRLLIA